MPCSLTSSPSKRLGVNAVLLVQGDPPQLQGPDTLDPALSFWKMPIRSNQLHFAFHHDRPISASFLDRRRGREKLKEAGTIEGRELSYDLGYYCARLSESFRQTGTSQVFSSLASQLSRGQLSRSNRQIFSGSKQCSLQSVVLSRKLPTRHPPAAPGA